MTVAACELYAGAYVCGIQAKGRCSSCGAAFCSMHTFRLDGGYVPYVDVCATCGARRWDDERAKNERENERMKAGVARERAWRAKSYNQAAVITKLAEGFVDWAPPRLPPNWRHWLSTGWVLYSETALQANKMGEGGASFVTGRLVVTTKRRLRTMGNVTINRVSAIDVVRTLERYGWSEAARIFPPDMPPEPVVPA